jgi:hypothetical protein
MFGSSPDTLFDDGARCPHWSRSDAPVNELSWLWIALALTVPPVVGGLIALPIWLNEQPILGNLAGSTAIFGAAIALIMREHVELVRLAQACLDRGFVCWPEPSAFVRYAIYAFIGLIEVMVLFSVSLTVERKIRRRGYDPEWR